MQTHSKNCWTYFSHLSTYFSHFVISKKVAITSHTPLNFCSPFICCPLWSQAQSFRMIPSLFVWNLSSPIADSSWPSLIFQGSVTIYSRKIAKSTAVLFPLALYARFASLRLCHSGTTCFCQCISQHFPKVRSEYDFAFLQYALISR